MVFLHLFWPVASTSSGVFISSVGVDLCKHGQMLIRNSMMVLIFLLCLAVDVLLRAASKNVCSVLTPHS